MIASTVSQYFKDSKTCNNILAATNTLGAMGKTSLVLLSRCQTVFIFPKCSCLFQCLPGLEESVDTALMGHNCPYKMCLY